MFKQSVFSGIVAPSVKKAKTASFRAELAVFGFFTEGVKREKR
jgi:hypothetical protein